MSIPPLEWLEGAEVDPAVLDLRPDYRVLLLTAEGLRPGPPDDASEAVLRAAEDLVRSSAATSAGGPSPEHPAGNATAPGRSVGNATSPGRSDAGPTAPGQSTGAAVRPEVAAWHDAYRAFGAKPQRTRPSVDALLRRASAPAGGLPRVDRITDVYNAVSVTHLLPIGGEDLDAYTGPPRLLRATGTEPFDTVANGDPVVEHPEPGEVVWTDAAGVTCRRWNHRQCVRTRLTERTTRAAFILDALDPVDRIRLESAGDALVAALRAVHPDVTVQRRLIGA